MWIAREMPFLRADWVSQGVNAREFCFYILARNVVICFSIFFLYFWRFLETLVHEDISAVRDKTGANYRLTWRVA